MTSDVSIQPDNRSGLQHALESLLDRYMGIIEAEAPYRTLLFPYKTPSQYLPALAIEKGVLDWAEDDAESAVRETVANGLVIQSHACTRQGIRDALAALGIDVRVTRSGPYELSVDAMLQDQPLDETTALRVMARINAYKAERDVADLKLVRKSNVAIYTGVAAVSEAKINVGTKPYPASVLTAPLATGCITYAVTRIDIPFLETT
ncbi:tail protein I [Trabulsiella guamensis ATCC 49490]|uniref:Tail protein I n=1 Tax=Trabulsiella guamensis ATCC 49490 TaxID=1005994 RepID=A0A085AFN4_9ENTR|nr:phage tail protein I [Trabulsiella guamensis]KFC09029.1 tail protein I [Trabulsiella guamensis ATCC 49490]